ncbi:sialidase family protein [Paenibacillus thiaminolyticus]|uniref:WD40/YVTN/BNR-like repeat-containing protein n=1 Tax=Paenibacillus thiaminolyticus TaxID=49283 RepID=UPI001C7220D7|nr:sialidase family protein [Paenibacillus thiaminolyticus]
MINVLNTTKKKTGAAILCGALALTLGTGATTTFAAEGKMDALMAKNENGVITYSTDGGQTWSENAPVYTETFEWVEEAGIKAKLMVKEENGKKLYSTDDGQTWSETAPEGLRVFFGKGKGESEGVAMQKIGKSVMSDGQTWSAETVELGEVSINSEAGITKVMVKGENGKKLYSTDDGQTWSETAPEGLRVFFGKGKGESEGVAMQKIGKSE